MIMNSINDEILLPQGYKMTELGPLPEEWEVVKLGEVCKVDWGNTSLTKKLYTANGYPAFSAAGNDGFLDFYEHDGEAVILSAIGARSGKCFYASGKWTAIKNTIVIKSNNETKINLLFLYFFVNNENYWHKSGSGQPFISIGVAQKQKLPLPPLPEQQKMAAVLSAVQEAKEKTHVVIDATKALKKSMMKHLFTYGPVSPEEAANVPLKETEIGKVPEDWEVVRLGDIAETYSGGTPRRDHKEYFEGKIGWLKSGELNDNYIYSTQELISEEGLRKSSAQYVESNTLLIALYGATAGKVGLAKRKFTINQAICAVRPNNKFWTEFYFYYFQTIRDKLLSMRFGCAQPNLNQQIVKNTILPLPPLHVQQKIASILSAIDEKIQAEEAKEKALEDLFRSLLSNLMSGKIRVKDLGIGNC